MLTVSESRRYIDTLTFSRKGNKNSINSFILLFTNDFTSIGFCFRIENSMVVTNLLKWILNIIPYPIPLVLNQFHESNSCVRVPGCNRNDWISDVFRSQDIWFYGTVDFSFSRGYVCALCWSIYAIYFDVAKIYVNSFDWQSNPH